MENEKEETEDNENETLRDLILQQLANLEPSDVSDDDSYKLRLSCILEDDESESSGGATAAAHAAHREFFPKDDRPQESEKGPPAADAGVRGSACESEESDDFPGGHVQITDLDDVTLCEEEPKEKTERELAEETNEEKSDGFAIKKLKSSDNVHKRPFVVRRRELSSDSSDPDISVTTSGEGTSGDAKIAEEEDTVDASMEVEDVEEVEEEEGKESGEREKRGEAFGGELEVVDNETLSSLFAKVSRTYLEKTKSNVKWEENEKIEKVFKEMMEEKKKKGKGKGEEKTLQTGDHSFSDVHIRGTSPKQYDPPVPPETYLWEELKRLRERGGYPWTYLDKPAFDEATWKKYMEHVYEPINPPPLSPEKRAELSREEATEKAASKGSIIPETEKRFSRAPSDRDLPRQDSGADKSRTSDEMEAEGTASVRQMQEDMESRFSAQTPSATSATTASQSRTDVTSSVLDTSGFEDLPVKETGLARNRREQMRAQAQDIQQKLRNHAGRIRTKFSNMPKPTLKRKDRLRREAPAGAGAAAASTAERSRFRLPEMHAPKINLPDRSKFKIPEKAKFHLPESAKLHLPDRSKFHLPERPKLNIAERARIHLPDKSKFHLPDKSKFHFPDKSKFHLPDKSKFRLPEKARFHLPDKSKFHLPERARFNLPHRPKLEMPGFARSSREAAAEPRSLKSRFDFDLKSYPKLFSKHSKEYTTSSPKQTRGRTPPPRMKPPETPAQSSEKWMRKLDDDLKYADEDLDEMRETDSRKSESLFDREGYAEDLEKLPQDARTLSTKSSASRLSDKELQSESSDDRKKGVLEEINPDEFFLRQKGISQDDIDVGKYLSREIREAFRSPDVNALARMDYADADEENLDPREYRNEPARPKRTGSIKKKSILKKSSKSTSDPSISEDGYKTYPPRRPGRKSRSQSKSLLDEEGIVARSGPGYEESETNLSRYDDLEEYEDNASEYYKTPGPAKEYQHYKVPRPHAPTTPSPPVKRKSSLEDESLPKRIHESWDEEAFRASEPPKAMARKKSKKKAGELDSTGEEQIPRETPKVPEEVVPEPQIVESPVPPKRTRTRSSGSRSLRSFVTEDEASRSFQSEPAMESEIVPEQRYPAEESFLAKSESEFMPRHRYEITDLDDAGFGYATVGKPTVPKPERQTKPDRPPPPRRKKEIAVPAYNTYPKRMPVRPLRNYSTLGPSRPPRQKRIPPIEKTLAQRQSRTYAEIPSRDFSESLDVIEVSGSSKDLQTEKVIEKMKGRPLPPPPRPPRQKSKGPEEDLEQTEEEKLSLSILRDDEFPLERRVTAFVHEPPVERENVEEICASTQTDPLPEDFSFGTEESSDVIQEFSHDQLRIQEAFLEEMKKEEEEMRRRGRGNENELVDAELKAEVIRQIEDIIAEEKRILEEKKNGERIRQEESEPKKPGKSYLDVDADMGYASLERRGHRQEPPAPSVPEIPTKMEKLEVAELDVGTLNVREVQSDQIFVKELQSNRISSQDIDNTGGTIALGNIDLPPSFIEQVVARIPWDTLRQTQEAGAQQEPAVGVQAPPVRPSRRQRGHPQDDSDDEDLYPPRRSHRRHHRPQHSTDEEEIRPRRAEDRRSAKSSEVSRNIPELSLELARACTSAGVQALKDFVQTNADLARSLDRELCVQGIICIAVALIAGFFLFGFDAKIVHLHHWDFQFPPQPPHA